MINLGKRIRELRKKKRLTQEQLAAALGVTPQAVSKWEMADTYPDMALIPVIAGYFEVSLDVLFGYDVNEMKKKWKTSSRMPEAIFTPTPSGTPKP